MSWKNESMRHAQSSRGIKTIHNNHLSKVNKDYPQMWRLEKEAKKYYDHVGIVPIQDDIINQMATELSEDNAVSYDSALWAVESYFKKKYGDEEGYELFAQGQRVISNVKPIIRTSRGDAYYIGTEVENEYGHWPAGQYSTISGFHVTHNGNKHHIYSTKYYMKQKFEEDKRKGLIK